MTDQPQDTALRPRLQGALIRARKDRDTATVAALRSALAALDNAEAVPVRDPSAGAVEDAPIGVGATEAPRRELSEDDVRRVLEREIADLENAAEQTATLAPERARDLRAGATALRALVPQTAGTLGAATEEAETPGPVVEARTDEVEAFWREAARHVRFDGVPGYLPGSPLAVIPPPAWAFGGTARQADELLALVLSGTKTATASALWDYPVESEPLPEVGGLGIVLDSQGRPRALVVTTRVNVVPFDRVTEEHARLEGEGDRSLTHWRQVHERFFREFRSHDREFAPDMPVVCERFRVLHPD